MERAMEGKRGVERELRSYLDNRAGLSFNLDTKSDRVLALQHGYVTGSRREGVARRRQGLDDWEAVLQAARARDGQRLARVEKLSEGARRTREEGLLRAHREVWMREWNRLQLERGQVQNELEEWRVCVGSGEHSFWREFLSEAAAVESQLCEEREDFMRERIQPLLRARGRLRGTLGRREREKEGEKREGEKAVHKLEEEIHRLWGEIATVCVEKEREMKDALQGIPLELAGEREAPNYGSALRELQLLDNHYTSTLETLHHRYQGVAGRGSCCQGVDGRSSDGWSFTDDERFRHVVGQYPSSLRKRRTLLIDRLMREFPNLTRPEIVKHEVWYNTSTHYQRQVASVKKSWLRNRTELERRLMEMLRRQKEVLEAEVISSAAKAEQRRKAEELYEKVCEWRREREEAARREEGERERERRKEEEEREREERKMAEHRAKLKAKVEVFHSLKKETAEREREEGEERREEREGENMEERRRGRERVSHREQLLRQRQEREEEARGRALAAVREREERLDKLRQTVEVKAACNPQRILQPTKAFESRVFVDSQPQLHAQHPLFTFHGYCDDVVTSDPRFKVAAALRKAGLLGSKYARHALSLVPPAHPPRPDQNSSVLK